MGRAPTPASGAAPAAVRVLLSLGYAVSAIDGWHKLFLRWRGSEVDDEQPHYSLSWFSAVYLSDVLVNFTMGTTLNRWSAMDVVKHHVPALGTVPLILLSSPSAATRAVHIIFNTASINELFGMAQSFSSKDTAARGAGRSKVEVLRRVHGLAWFQTFGLWLFYVSGKLISREARNAESPARAASYVALLPLGAWFGQQYGEWTASNAKWLWNTTRYPAKLYWLVSMLALATGMSSGGVGAVLDSRKS